MPTERPLRIAFGSDHAGVQERQDLITHLKGKGYLLLDLGCAAGQSVDYPDFGAEVGRAVASGRVDRGVLICGTGLGICMAANKVHGVRAATVHDEFTAEMARRHNDANVICMGARLFSVWAMQRMLDRFLATPFEGGRHALRVAKIMALESAETPTRGS